MIDYDVICIGFAVQDIILKGIPDNALQKDSTYTEDITITPGGDAANQAAVLSALGKKTALIANFGYDAIGRQLEEQFGREGIDITYAVRREIEKSNISVVVVKQNKDRSFLVGKGKGRMDIDIKDIHKSLLEHTKAVSLGSLYFLKKLDGNGAAQIFRAARERHVLTFADMTADAYHIGPHGIDEVYPYTDFLIPSYEEAVYASGCQECDAAADYFLEKGVKTVVIKLGGKGCFVKSRKQRFFTEPYEIQGVDTSGCGDSFCAGFIYGILEHMSLPEAVEYATAAGAVNAEYVGAHGNIKNKTQIVDFMETTSKKSIIW